LSEGIRQGVITNAVKYDSDGCDIYFLNAMDTSLEGCTSAQEVSQIFDQVQLEGSTPTEMRLDDLLRPYVEECEDKKAAKAALPKPLILVVITDGRCV